MFFSGIGGWIIGGIGSGIPLLMDEFGEDLKTTADGAINWAVLALGAGVRTPMFFRSLTLFLEFYLASRSVVFWHASNFLGFHIVAIRNFDLVCSSG